MSTRRTARARVFRLGISNFLSELDWDSAPVFFNFKGSHSFQVSKQKTADVPAATLEHRLFCFPAKSREEIFVEPSGSRHLKFVQADGTLAGQIPLNFRGWRLAGLIVT
jgi:hypothetical protein